MLRESSRIAWMPGALASFEGRHGRSATPFLTEVVSWTARFLRVPEQGQSTGCHHTGRFADRKKQPPVPGVQEAQCGIQRGLLLGIACRIDPCFQATCNSDSGKDSVNRNSAPHATIAPFTVHSVHRRARLADKSRHSLPNKARQAAPWFTDLPPTQENLATPWHDCR